eukprot:TRINITY_DN18384_c0_g2_i1.p1 TRINITY_DN18384_c0_g2~~TRINITY_DN18384_c0_g2_i1.p1  ORF type:complete len:271 (-),score=81.57 TRINITY_DN18384_c0_g2_i1:24-836(-)
MKIFGDQPPPDSFLQKKPSTKSEERQTKTEDKQTNKTEEKPITKIEEKPPNKIEDKPITKIEEKPPTKVVKEEKDSSNKSEPVTVKTTSYSEPSQITPRIFVNSNQLSPRYPGSPSEYDQDTKIITIEESPVGSPRSAHGNRTRILRSSNGRTNSRDPNLNPILHFKAEHVRGLQNAIDKHDHDSVWDFHRHHINRCFDLLCADVVSEIQRERSKFLEELDRLKADSEEQHQREKSALLKEIEDLKKELHLLKQQDPPTSSPAKKADAFN